MSLRKVARGEPFQPRAEDWNAFVDAARDYRSRQHGIGVRMLPGGERSGLVVARNRSGADQPQFAALWLHELAIRPDDPETEQRFRTGVPVFDLRLYADIAPAVRHEMRFAVLQEPLKADGVGRAMVCGVTPVHVLVQSEAHDYAGPSAADPTSFQSAFLGPCRILWKQPGTGLKWSLVQFPFNDAPRVLVENASGEVLRDGYACMVDGCGAKPWTLRVKKPTGDSRLQVFAYSGPDLAAGEGGVARPGEVMRFQVDVAGLLPGEFVGTRSGSWMLTRNKFGFLVLGAETVGSSFFVYARYSGLPPVLKAASDENTASHTISVRHVDSNGAPMGAAFTLDVIPEP